MTQRDARRLALARRQLALARIARREAMGALAGAVAEETKRAALAARSRTLAAGYGARCASADNAPRRGDELADTARFAAALSNLARNTETSREDAAREAEASAQALAGAERRCERLEQHEAAALGRIVAAAEARADSAGEPLARKLQTSRQQDQDAPGDGVSQRRGNAGRRPPRRRA